VTGPKEVFQDMLKVQQHTISSPTTFVQYGAAAALNGPQAPVAEMVKQFHARRDVVVKGLCDIGLRCEMPEGAFYVYADISCYLGKELCGVKLGSSLDFAQVMLEKGHVAVIPGAAFGTDKYIRLSYATSMDTIKNGLDAFESFIKENLK
jgi:aspartate aminotransferase